MWLHKASFVVPVFHASGSLIISYMLATQRHVIIKIVIAIGHDHALTINAGLLHVHAAQALPFVQHADDLCCK